MCKIFSLVPSKKPEKDQRKLRLSVYFSIFEGYNLQLYQKKPFGNWQFVKIGVLVIFIIQKLKSKHLRRGHVKILKRLSLSLSAEF